MPLPGSFEDPSTTPQEQDVLGPRDPASSEAVRDVLMSGGTTGSLTGLVLREGRRQVNAAARGLGMAPPTRELEADEANARFGIAGELSFSKPVSEEEAAWRHEAKRDELYRRNVLARNESFGVLGSFGLSMLGGVVDPLGAGLTLVPVVGEARLAALFGQGALGARGALAAGRGAAAARGATLGALEGFGGGLVTEGATYGLAGIREGRDYDAGDLAFGLTFGTILGAGAGGVLGAAGWRPPGASRNAQVADLITSRAAAMGEDANVALAIAQLESGLNPRAKNRLSSASGVFQFLQGKDTAWEKLGGGDPFDATTNVERGIQLLAENRKALRATLGREPEGWELYLAHQQGIGGARRLLANPDSPAVRLVGRDAVIKNGGRDDMTAAQFAGLWRDKFNGLGAPGGGARPAIPDGFDPLPRVVSMLDEEVRAGALAKAIDDAAMDRPTDVGALIEQELAVSRPRVDEDAFEVVATAEAFHVEPRDPAVREAENPEAITGIAGDVLEGGSIWRVHYSGLPPEVRGRGLGVEMYEAAAQRADQAGARLASHEEVSADAARVWDALERRGYEVARHPQAKFERDAKANGGGYWLAPRGKSVFEVKALPKSEPAPTRAPAPAAAVAADEGPAHAIVAEAARRDRQGVAVEPEPVALGGVEAREPGARPSKAKPAGPGRPRQQEAAPKSDAEAEPQAPADPELAELEADVAALTAELGDEVAIPDPVPSDAVSEAVRAAVFCLREGGAG